MRQTAKTAVEMTDSGKRGKPKAGFPSLPTALGNRATRFPHFHRLDCGCVFTIQTTKNKTTKEPGLKADLQAHPSMRICLRFIYEDFR